MRTNKWKALQGLFKVVKLLGFRHNKVNSSKGCERDGRAALEGMKTFHPLFPSPPPK